MIKLVAFDWNGTLFSDMAAISHAVNNVLKLFDLGPVDLREMQKSFDVPVDKSYLKLGVNKDELIIKSGEVQKTFHSTYEPRAAKVRTRAYAKNLLEFLSKNNIYSIIFSNHIDEPIKKQLKRLKIEKYFVDVLANSEIHSAFKIRSKSEKLKKFLLDKNLSVKDALIVGDTIEEMEIGKELGILTVAITDGNCSTDRLKAAKPDYLINNLKEIINIIKKINCQH